MSKPRLHVFAISHFCEKARWALDYLEVDYDLEFEAPGPHIRNAKQLGVARSSLPILATESEAVQGSGAIIDWADAHTDSGRTLTPKEHADECRAIERRLDDVVGVHTRRCFYSEALVEHPETVKPIFRKDLSALRKVALDASWPWVRKQMIERMDLGAEQGEQSREILEGELSWLDEKLADGRRFLVGDRFSRADLSAASLLARVAAAKEHPAHRFMQLPPRMAALQSGWESRPSLAWIRGLYTEFR